MKQTKEQFLSNLNDHANGDLDWGKYSSDPNGAVYGASTDFSLQLDRELNEIYNDCVAAEKELCARVEYLNKKCKEKLASL